MSVTTKDGVTTLKPTAWKWFAGATAVFFFIPGFGWMLSLAFVLMGTGHLQNLVLSPTGVKVRNWWSTKAYAWEDIDDFRIHHVSSGIGKAANMVAFTHAEKDGTLMGNAAKFLVGGTHTIPAVGMPAKKLVQVMEAYKRGFIPSDSAVPAATINPAPLPPMFQPARDVSPEPVKREKPRPRAVPATPRAQHRATSKKTNLSDKQKTSTPLVQEGGGLFRQRRSDSPFGS